MANKTTYEDKQNLKRKRIKMYFLEAAKEIIIHEGVENVSVRKVADIAGYSYATIYNYYKDLNELLCDVKTVMINDLAAFMNKEILEAAMDMNGVKSLFKSYIEYFFKNPNVFVFFFLYRLNKSDKETEEVVVPPDFDHMWEETFKGLLLKGVVNEKEIEVLSKILIYTLHGMLTLSFSQYEGPVEEAAYRDLDRMIEYLLNKSL